MKLDEDRATLGLAPDRAMKGDLICIVKGCSVPVVLRKVIEPQSTLPGDAAIPDQPNSTNPNAT